MALNYSTVHVQHCAMSFFNRLQSWSKIKGQHCDFLHTLTCVCRVFPHFSAISEERKIARIEEQKKERTEIGKEERKKGGEREKGGKKRKNPICRRQSVLARAYNACYYVIDLTVPHQAKAHHSMTPFTRTSCLRLISECLTQMRSLYSDIQ